LGHFRDAGSALAPGAGQQLRAAPVRETGAPRPAATSSLGGEHAMKKLDTRLSLGLAAVTAAILFSAATSEALIKKPPIFGRNPDLVFTPVPPPQPTPVPPFARPGISIVERREVSKPGDPPRGTSLTIEVCDRSSQDTKHALFRGTDPETADDVIVAQLTSPSPQGCFRFENTGLQPDTNYCFRAAPMDFTSVMADYFSGTVCAYTREAENHPVWRVELAVRTANGSNGDTEDPVRVRLNSALPPAFSGLPTFIPNGNETFLDYGRDDFERNKTDTYDLNLGGISELGDIHQISFAINGDDQWCIAGFSLFVNGVKVYNENRSPCIKSEDWGTAQTSFFSVSHDKLRAHPLWKAYKTPKLVDATEAKTKLEACETVDVLTIKRAELESRIEGIVGHSINFNKLEWGDLFGERYVEAQATEDPQVAHVDLDLQAAIPVLDNPEVDIDLDLRFAMTCAAGGIDFQFATENFVVDANPGLFTEFVGSLFCAVSGDCKPGLETTIEKKVREAFRPLSRTISIQSKEAVGACALGYLPTVVVTDEADLVISIEPKSPCNPAPTPTPNPYGRPRDAFLRQPGLLLGR
jgi:hypothetical protein